MAERVLATWNETVYWPAESVPNKNNPIRWRVWQDNASQLSMVYSDPKSTIPMPVPGEEQPEPGPDPGPDPGPGPGPGEPPASGGMDGIAELPRKSVDVSWPELTGQSITVQAGGNLQAAIDGLQGDASNRNHEIVLAAGATYGSIILRTRPDGAGWITIRTSGQIPPPGTRIKSGDASKLAKLTSKIPYGRVVQCENRAHHYRLVGLECVVDPSIKTPTNNVLFGNGEEASTLATMPHHLIVDRCYIHGTATGNLRRGVCLNCGDGAVIDSWIGEVHERGSDAQGICGWNGPGPFLIRNNYVEASSENIMFGGMDPTGPDMIPQDITVQRNHIFKPMSWKGGTWVIKNLFELKMGKRVLVENNVLENCWVAAQGGFAFRLKSENQDQTAPFTETAHVVVRLNKIVACTAPFSLSGVGYGGNAVPMNNLVIRDNYCQACGETGKNESQAHSSFGAIKGLVYERNTFEMATCYSCMILDQDYPDVGPGSGLVIRSNLVPLGTYPFKGGGYPAGPESLDHFFPGWICEANTYIGKASSAVPPGNTVVSSPEGASGGCDIAAVEAAVAGVV